jgi:hypothetical protein
MVSGTLQAMATLRANDFADDKKPEDTGLAKPGLTVTAVAKGKPYVLQVGNTVGEDTYVKTPDDPTIYTIKKYQLERIAHKPIDFRDKTLVKAKEADLASIDITVGAEGTSLAHAGDKWTATFRGEKAKAKADDAKVKPLVGGFEALQGSGYADKEAAKTAFSKPSGQVVLKLKDKSTVTLKIGALTKDSADYYVQKVGSPDIMLVKKYAIDRFLKKPSDLAQAEKKS